MNPPRLTCSQRQWLHSSVDRASHRYCEVRGSNPIEVLNFFFVGFFTQLHKLRSLRRSFLHFHFISAVHIWFISYIINTHFFHGKIWTNNWPAPNANGFIAKLVEHRTGNREVTGSNLVEVLKFFQASLGNCINCVYDHFFIFTSFPQLWSFPAPPRGGGGGVNVCLACAAGLSESIPHYSLFCGQL